MRVSRRQDNLAPYLFIEINKKIAEKKARGEEVISFGIGDPDIPTPSHIIERFHAIGGQMPVTTVQNHFRRALGICCQASIRLMQSGHAFCFG